MNKLLIIILSLGLIGGNLLRLQFGNGIAITALDIGVALIGIKAAYTLFKVRNISFSPASRSFLMFLMICMISLFLNSFSLHLDQFATALLYLIRYSLYVSIYFFIRSLSRSDKSFAFYAFLTTGVGLVIIGFIQYFFYSNLRNLYYLGWDEHLYRMFSTFLDPNFAGAFFVLFFIFLLVLSLYTKLTNKTLLYGMYLVSIFTLLSIVLTFSRSAFVMLGSSLLIASLLSKYKKIIFFLLLFSFFILWLFSNTLIESKNPFRLASSHARIDSAQNALIIISHYPVLGVGFNTYRYAQERLGLRDEHTQFVSHADSGTDTSLLFITATTGIVGLLFFCNFLYLLLKRSYDLFKTKKNTFALIFFISISSLLINSIFINSLFYPMIMAWIVVLYGFMENTLHDESLL